MRKVLIVGAGELGRALDFVLSQNSNNQIWIWDRKRDRSRLGSKGVWTPLDGTVTRFEPDFVFLAIPTQAIDEVVATILKVRREQFCLVLLSKGLDRRGRTSLEIVQDRWLGPTALISGPMIAEELNRGLEAKALVAGNLGPEIVNLVSLFSDTNLSLSQTDDLIGLSWVGPLKNIYAIGLGITAAQEKGRNYQGWFVAQAVKEMAQLVKFLGGKRKTAYSLAGLGDLIATGFSPDSSNWQFGFALGKGEKPDRICEGVMVASGLKTRLEDKLANWPLLREIVNML